MQQAIPYNGGRAWGPPQSPPWCSSGDGEELKKAIAESPVVVVGRKGCCMSHVVNRLLLSLGVNPAVFEVNEVEAIRIDDELMAEQGLVFPAVFIGGRLVGGLDRLMAVHISGELVPILKEARALWL